jgi:hypothetical protein
VVHEPRSFKVQGRVTENIINQMEQAKLLNPEYNESMQVFIALEMMYNDRNKTSKFENLVDQSVARTVSLELKRLQNRVSGEQNVHSLVVLVELLSLEIREYPKTESTDLYIRDLARIIYDIRPFSNEYYKICCNMASKLLLKRQAKIFKNQIDECIHVPCVSYIIGGTLDTPDDTDVSELVNNCLTVPKNKKQGKIDDTLHYIVQHYEEPHIVCEAFLNEIERKDNDRKQN